MNHAVRAKPISAQPSYPSAKIAEKNLQIPFKKAPAGSEIAPRNRPVPPASPSSSGSSGTPSQGRIDEAGKQADPYIPSSDPELRPPTAVSASSSSSSPPVFLPGSSASDGGDPIHFTGMDATSKASSLLGGGGGLIRPSLRGTTTAAAANPTPSSASKAAPIAVANTPAPPQVSTSSVSPGVEPTNATVVAQEIPIVQNQAQPPEPARPFELTQQVGTDEVLFKLAYTDGGTMGSVPTALVLPAIGGDTLMIPGSTLSPTDPQHIMPTMGPVLYRSIQGPEERLNVVAKLWENTFAALPDSTWYRERPDEHFENAGSLVRIVACGTIAEEQLQNTFSKNSTGETVDAASYFFYKTAFQGEITNCKNPVYRDFRVTEDWIQLDLTVQQSGMYVAMLIPQSLEQDAEFNQKVGASSVGASNGSVPTPDQLTALFTQGVFLRGIRVQGANSPI